jgi:hypothetical protein
MMERILGFGIKPGIRQAAGKSLGLLATALLLGLSALGPLACRAEPQPEPGPVATIPAPPAVIGNESPYRFTAIGDWGTGNAFQKDVARQMADLYRREPFDAVLMLGDNIYEDGDINKYGKAYFTDMYAPLIQGGVQFIVALGNHDRRGGFQDDQVRFFKMPGYYYQVQKPGIDFFVLDTNTFSGDEIQRKWLEKALADSKASWQVVLGHHPIYSSGEHGVNPVLQKTLEPILVRGGADFYLAGHDHDYERLTPIRGVQHIVSGGGGAWLRGFPKVLPQSLVRREAHHFLSFESDASGLKMQVYDKTGDVIDKAAWPLAQTLPRPAARRASGSVR